MLLLQIGVEKGAIVMKGYPRYPKAPSREPHHQIVLLYSGYTLASEVLPLIRDAISVFYRPSLLGSRMITGLIGRFDKSEVEVGVECSVDPNEHDRFLYSLSFGGCLVGWGGRIH